MSLCFVLIAPGKIRSEGFHLISQCPCRAYTSYPAGSFAATVAFGLAQGLMNSSLLDVHGAGAVRSGVKSLAATGVTIDELPLGGGGASGDIEEGVFVAGSSSTVPEPSAIALMGLGLLGFGVTRRKQKKS